MFYLGVDGGGTKTAFALISQDGRILAHTTAGTSHPDQIGMEQVRVTLQQGVNEVCSQAGISVSDITFSFWGLPGFGENLAHVPQLENMAEEILQSKNFRCGNDVEAGWAGSLACQPGVHLVAGTGAIGYGVDRKGNTARSSGWSEIFGDEGSAHWLGKHLLELFSKQSDYRLERTPLYELVRDKLELERDLDLMAIIGDLSKRDEIAKLAVVVYEAAQRDDEQAIALFKEAAFEHSLTVKAIIQQLDFPADQPIPVSYSGGVFKSGDFILKPLQDYLTPHGATLVQPTLSPVVGACLYALVLSGEEASEKIVKQLQEAEDALNLQ